MMRCISRYFPVVWIFIFLNACGQMKSAHDSQLQSEGYLPLSCLDQDHTKYIQAPIQYSGLLRVVHNHTIKICYFDKDNSKRRKEVVRAETLKWLDRLRSQSQRKITSNVEIGPWRSSDCDAFLEAGSHSVANTTMGNKPHIKIQETGWYGSDTVILHELGHAFGLLDTYEGRGGKCKPNQPKSVMCTANFSEPQSDDEQGIQALYRRVFPNG